MSSDNGIYILQSLDGWRVIHAQAIENLYWHHICCDNPDIIYIEDLQGCSHEKCLNCARVDPIGIQKNELNSQMLKQYFEEAQCFKTEQDALEEAIRLYNEIMNNEFYPICEYGICFIRGWENKEFPK